MQVHKELPRYGNAGMGVGISTGALAGEVAALGYIGTVSLVGAEQSFAYDCVYDRIPADVAEILADFPDQRLIYEFWAIIEKLRRRDRWVGFKWQPQMNVLEPGIVTLPREISVLALVAAYVEIRRAVRIAEGRGLIAVNLMWKVQLPFLLYLYASILAGVEMVVVGAGVSSGMPEILEALSRHQSAERQLEAVLLPDRPDHFPDQYRLRFDPSELFSVEGLELLPQSLFMPIVGSNVLLARYVKQLGSDIAAYMEKPDTAGGHVQSARKQDPATHRPTFGPKDDIRFDEIKVRYYLGGDSFTPEGLAEAEEVGAYGVFGGTLFALCSASGMARHLRYQAQDLILKDEMEVFALDVISPTTLQFRIANMVGTYAEHILDRLETNDPGEFIRSCTVGLLAELVEQPSGVLIQRCSAENLKAYANKGGDDPFAPLRACLCRQLSATAGRPQIHTRTTQEGIDMVEDEPIVTLGEGKRTLEFARFLLTHYGREYTPADIFKALGL